MSKKKPKPATAGKRIAGDVYPERTIDHTICRMKLARRIDRAVRKERERCVNIIKDARANPNTSLASEVAMSNLIVKIEGQRP